MYKVIVNAHNLKEIQTEPIEMFSKTGEHFACTVTLGLESILSFVEHGGLKSRSLTIEISELNK